MSGVTKGRNEPCLNSIGGITNLYLFSYVDYRNYQIEVNANTLVTFPETTIYDYELRADGNSFNETLQIAEDGISYNQEVSAILKQVKPDYIETGNLLNKRVRCIVKTRRGQYFIIGLFNGCRVPSVSFTSGSSKNSFNGANLSISAKEINQAYYIDNLESAGFTISGQEPTLYLLDTYPALIAHSMRKLSSIATAGIRLRRSSDNAETDVILPDEGFIDGLSTVTAGGDLSTWGMGNTLTVVKVYNQGDGGSSYDYFQTVTTKQPVYNLLGGYLDFAIGNTGMNTTLPLTANQGSLFSVWENIGSTSVIQATIVQASTTSGNWISAEHLSNSGTYNTGTRWLVVNSGTQINGSGAINLNLQKSVVNMSSDGSRTLYGANGSVPNNITVISGSDTGLWFGSLSTAGYNMQIGFRERSSTAYGTGRYFEDIIFSTEQNLTDTAAINANIISAHGI